MWNTGSLEKRLEPKKKNLKNPKTWRIHRALKLKDNCVLAGFSKAPVSLSNFNNHPEETQRILTDPEESQGETERPHRTVDEPLKNQEPPPTRDERGNQVCSCLHSLRALTEPWRKLNYCMKNLDKPWGSWQTLKNNNETWKTKRMVLCISWKTHQSTVNLGNLTEH